MSGFNEFGRGTNRGMGNVSHMDLAELINARISSVGSQESPPHVNTPPSMAHEPPRRTSPNLALSIHPEPPSPSYPAVDTDQGSSASVMGGPATQRCVYELVETPLVDSYDIEKLKNAGYHTVESVAKCSSEQFEAILGMTGPKVATILAKAKELAPRTLVWLDGSYAAIDRQKYRVTTGARDVDRILGGGIQSGVLTEIFGASGTGKTQLAHTLAVTCQLPQSMGGAMGKCLYVDTEGGYRTDRIVQISHRFGFVGDTILKNISVAKPRSAQEQMQVVPQLRHILSVSKKYVLVIVDSAMCYFRNENIVRGEELIVRKQKLNAYLHSLRRVAEDYNVAVVVVIQMMGPNPIGVLGEAMQYRLELRHGPRGTKVAKLVKCSHYPEDEGTFLIGPGGVMDVPL